MPDFRATPEDVSPMHSGPETGPDVEPFDIGGCELLCAVCARGGCPEPPPGEDRMREILDILWSLPYRPLRITADEDVIRGHYFDAWGGRSPENLPPDHAARIGRHVRRFKDMQVCRLLGIVPNSVIPAYLAYETLFRRLPTLDGVCRTASPPSEAWPRCPHADAGYYERIAGEDHMTLAEQTEEGERLAGRGIWALLQPRTAEEMETAKRESARRIIRTADRLFIRPNHLLCILCAAEKDDPLVEDNLVELRQRMEAEPDIPVTLIEGCCMVCDPCNVYHPDEHLCYRAHIKNGLRDLYVLERLGLEPGATLPARDLYRRIYDRIESLTEICGWGDELDTAPWWAPCGGYRTPAFDEARKKGVISDPPDG